MAGRASRNKGARGELEVIAMLQPIVDKVCEETGHPSFVLRRNQDQRYAPKQYDLIGVPWVALEVKRVENQSGIGSWWRQTKEATKDGQIPILIYRPNHQKWKVRCRIPILAGITVIRATVNVDIETFLVWFEYFLKSKLK